MQPDMRLADTHAWFEKANEDGVHEICWIFRYPGDLHGPADTDAAAVLNKERAFVEALLARLPEEAD